MNAPNPPEDVIDAAFRRQSSALMSGAVTGWARIIDHSLTSLVALWKIPLDLVYPEDAWLGVCTARLGVPAATADSVRCLWARSAGPDGSTGAGTPTNPAVGVDIRLLPDAGREANPTTREIEVTLAPTARPGLYELRFIDDSTQDRWTVFHPFGVPRGDH